MFVMLCRTGLVAGIAVAGLLAGSLSHFANAGEKTGKAVRYALPENGNEVIFVFDLKNGFTPPRQNNSPTLLIRANGKIEMPSLYGEGRDIEGKLNETELQEFLRFVIEEKKFVEFDANTVQGQIEEIREKKQVPRIADVPDTIVELKIPGHANSVRQPDVGMPSEFKQVEDLQRLLAIRKRVNQLMSETRVGGKQGITKLLVPINKKLRQEYPDVAPLVAQDFSGSYMQQDGSITATVSRAGRDREGKPNGTYVTGTARLSPGGDKPEITLRVKLK